jgi:hypothetical protein
MEGFSMPQYTERSGGPPPPSAASSKRAWEIFSRPNRIFFCWSHTWQKKSKKKKQNSETLNPQPI